MIHIIRTGFVLFSLCCFTAYISLADEPIKLADGRISFIPPTGFKPLTKDQIAIKFPNANAPQHVFANDSQSVSVAVTFSPSKLLPDQLPEFKEKMEELMPRLVPGLKWVDREIVKINGRQWVHFELTSYAIDTEIHNHMYFTSFDGKMLGFNYNSIESKYADVEASFEKSVSSIAITD